MNSNWILGRGSCLAKLCLALILCVVAYGAIFLYSWRRSTAIRKEGDAVVQWINTYKVETGEYPKSLDMHCNYRWNYARTDWGYVLSCYYFLRSRWAYVQPTDSWIELDE